MSDRFIHVSGDVGAESIIIKQQRQEIEQLKEAKLKEAKLKEAIRRLAAQDATLTTEEREAVEAAIRIVDAHDEEMDGFPSGAALTLRSLLERLT